MSTTTPLFYMRLVAPAVVVPENPMWGAQVLGTGTTVAMVLPQTAVSPITGTTDEHFVQWLDSTRTPQYGWLAEYTLWTDYKVPELRRMVFHRNEGLSAWDHLRSKMVGLQRLAPLRVRPLARQWMVQHARTHRAEVVSTLRQFGDTKLLASSCTTDELTCRALTLILHRSYTMKNHMDDSVKLDIAADESTEKAAPKKSAAKKSSAKKSSTAKKTAPAKKAATKTTAKKTAKKSAAKKTATAAAGSNARDPKEAGALAVTMLKKARITDGAREAGLLANGKKINNTSFGTLISACNAGKVKAREAGHEEVAVTLYRLSRKFRNMRAASRA